MILPGSGHPADPVGPGVPPPVSARSAAGVSRLAARATLEQVDARVSVCRACPRLVAWREQVAHERRASYAEEEYWGRPVPGFGDPAARVLVMGLAPAAHGANRTGRVFTGDRSGDWLFASMHRVGLASQPTSRHAGDGLELVGTRVVAAVRCAPPANQPTPVERDTCAPWVEREVRLLLPTLRVVVCLGGFGWEAALRALAGAGAVVPRPRPRFGHGVEVALDGLTLLGCFHPSQQNTFTGRLTEPMTDAVLGRAAELASL
ncbi:uracil-DNA glycosylase [Nocardioides aurantiacus]|uniref:Type-5 uracil-DNA glycosylase n=1 Tax=Nocardioides aurantiacus TaxID=86796 RepID=A0A3N2CQC4_9ACTN|nr:uracil-DNA glycosylase [Nocardioides aurantiacus]ROR89731.1 uracil-DNA glycosylase family 4 [Nocardioides aurantiacus]